MINRVWRFLRDVIMKIPLVSTYRPLLKANFTPGMNWSNALISMPGSRCKYCANSMEIAPPQGLSQILFSYTVTGHPFLARYQAAESPAMLPPTMVMGADMFMPHFLSCRCSKPIPGYPAIYLSLKDSDSHFRTASGTWLPG